MRGAQIIPAGLPWLIMLGLAATFPATSNAAPAEAVLHAFQGGTDGAAPEGAGLVDAAGNIYATTSQGGLSVGPCAAFGCGTLVRLSPPAAGGTSWTIALLHDFGAGPDGATPVGGLVADANGILFGTTISGGYTGICIPYGCGTVFAVNPALPLASNESVLHAFTGTKQGTYPAASLALDSFGELFGTTGSGGGTGCTNSAGCGTVYRLTPTSGGTAWGESRLLSFAASGKKGEFPEAPLLVMPSGTLIGTTLFGGGCPTPGCGTIFSLVPPATGNTVWRQSLLHSFTGGTDGIYPWSNLAADAQGNLYGTTYGSGSDFGTVYRLTPPGAGSTKWKLTTLYRFAGGLDGANPRGNLAINSAGVLFGATEYGGNSLCSGTGCGTVFRLTPPGKNKRWTELVLYRFQGGVDGALPLGGVVRDMKGRLYGTTLHGGGAGCTGSGCGVVFRVIP